jgi:hypothetical protein
MKKSYFVYLISIIFGLGTANAGAITAKVRDVVIDFRGFAAGTCEGQQSKSAFIYFDLISGNTQVAVYTNNDSNGKNLMAMALSAASSGASVTVGYTANTNCNPSGAVEGQYKIDYFVLTPN